ncbi:MAG: DUF4198 domain-containing protein [Boseongicola sp.]|nr:DUF4198 domain-containing protein [Boseongicola sp.]NNJ67096.1 DUF4198 domain-containing protein [Boseongicola sp.]
MFRTLVLAASLTCMSIAAKAHEFWIDPAEHLVSTSDQVVAALRVGQDFVGNSQAYLPQNFVRFDYAMGGEVMPVEGRIGDRPALRMDAPGDGLMVVIHQTTGSLLTWDEFERFEAFVEHKDAMWTLEAHKARGLSEENVREVYSRFAKSLVGVGSAAGDDIVAGMETEIIALENPYTGNMSDGLDVRVLYRGAPRVDEQVEVYELTESDEMTVFTVRTDGNGVATVPVKAGARYMLDSVVLREPSAELASQYGVAWESLWANLTFGVPAN